MPEPVMTEDAMEPTPEAEAGTSITLTFYADGQIQVGEPMPAEARPEAMEMEGPMEGHMGRDGGYMAQADQDGGMPAGGGQMFSTMEEAMRYLLQVAESVNPAEDESMAMNEGYGMEMPGSKGPN